MTGEGTMYFIKNCPTKLKGAQYHGKVENGLPHGTCSEFQKN